MCVRKTYQDVNQLQVFGVATLGLQHVFHAGFCRVGREPAAAPVQPVVHLQPQRPQRDTKLSARGCVYRFPGN